MRIAPLLTAALLLPGCFDAGDDASMSNAELARAMGVLVETGRPAAFSGEVVQISTSFTLGDAWEQHVENLRAFYESQAPCSTVTRQDATITIDFGDLTDLCTFRGRTWGGVQTLTLVSVEQGQVVLEHGWEGLTDGLTTLDGGATVTWTFGELTRQVDHEATWTTWTSTIEATGAETQSLVNPDNGFEDGILFEGVRDWDIDGEPWTLDIQAVEARGADPIPQAGEYVLTNPDGKQLTATFDRQDVDTIRMTLTSGDRSKAWDVTAEGVDEVE